MKKFNLTIKVLILLSLLAGSYSVAQAQLSSLGYSATSGQGDPGGGYYTADNYDGYGRQSDYQVNATCTTLGGNYDCWQTDNRFKAGTSYGDVTYINDDQSCNNTGNGHSYQTYASDNVILGPSKTITMYIQLDQNVADHYLLDACATATSGHTSTHNITTFTIGTAAIYPPSGGGYTTVNVTNIANAQFTRLSWNKGSDIPDDSLMYIIYRDNTPLDTIPAAGSNMYYIDSTLLSTRSYAYSITSYTHAWGKHESTRLNVNVNIVNDLMVATDGSVYGKTHLTWPNLASYGPNGIEVFSNGQQLAVVDKNSVAYDDFTGVPGYKYNYSIGPINTNNQVPFQYSDSGYSRPNGVLSGYVRSLQGAGVPGVLVTATGIVDTGRSYTYADSTDATGYYSIHDIYYDTSTTYTVYATRSNDQFTPSAISRTITVQNFTNSLADIIDTTVFTVQGNVTYAGHPSCGVQGANVYVNGSYTGIVTDGSGHYLYTALVPGTYVFTLQYLDHTFDSSSRSVTVFASQSGIDFHDLKRDTLVIDLKSGCNTQVCNTATFEVISDPTTANAGCFDSTYNFDGFDPVVLVLPAMKYRVNKPTAYQPGNSSPDLNIPNALDPISIDLTQRDTFYVLSFDTVWHYTAATHTTLPDGHVISTPGDTSITAIDTTRTAYTPYKQAKFVYHGPLSIDVTQLDSTCVGYVVNQNQRYPVGIFVHEESSYNGHVNPCLQDTGTVYIYDNVTPVIQYTGELVHGELVYWMVPGIPNVPSSPGPHQYQNLFEVTVTAGNAPPVTKDLWIMTQGNKTLTATFISKAPPMPLMVLHDPPGSASYSSLEKDSSFSLNTATLANTTLQAGGYAQVQFGKVATIPFAGINLPGAYVNVQVSGTGGYSRDSDQSQTMTVTANQTISTSGDPNFVGFNGDVFIGSTIDNKYAYGYQFNVINCVPKVDTVLLTGIDSMESNFVYSTSDIKGTILPQLAGLVQAAPDTSKAYYQDQINMWTEILTQDSITIAHGTYGSNNISFGAGSSQDYSVASDSNYQNTYNYTVLGNLNASIGAGISDAQLINVNAGATLQFSTSHNKTNVGTADQSKIFSYHLEDDVPGNIYGVEIASDPHFGSPMFKLFAGTSACPWEPGTQHRDMPTMTIDPAQVFNVPVGSPAAFVAYLGNQSESLESRTYQVSVAPESNLDGATIKIGGQDITQNPASFTINYGDQIATALTVTEGPFAADYNDLLISFSSACDPNVSVTVPISAHFQSSCSDVSLALPNDNWLVNSSSHDTLNVSFTGFNASNPNLVEIGLQYRLAGSTNTWSQGPIVPLARLTQTFVSIPFNVTNLPDGNYQIRAYASCGAVNGGTTYSSTLNGVIDRASFNLFGTPSPANGVLNINDEISIQFNENIDCNQTYEPMQVTLTRADNGAVISDSFACYTNKLIITTNPTSFLDSLDGKIVTATVNKIHDLNGNQLTNPVSWSFVVSRSQIYWTPGSVNITAVKGTSPTLLATMENVGVADSFIITHKPSWLTITQAGPYYVANGTQSPSDLQVPFTVVGSLNQGHYVDTVIAKANGKNVYLYVTLDVVTQAPNWTVNPNNFQYSMSITTNYSTTTANTPLSSDTRDEIAVFVGNECRGYAHIAYDGTSNKYVAFITAYSNRSVGDTFTFRMWDALPGIEYQALERLPFIQDGAIGQALAPYILHAGGVFQTIPLSVGWNWFSLNVANTDMSPKNVLSSIAGNNGAIVKTQDVYAQFTNPSAGWQGALTSFSTNKSYMIQLDHADTLHFLGQLVTDSTLYQIQAGWNWIGFPRVEIAADSTFMQDANLAAGDLLKSETQYAQYSAAGWSGSLSYMYPGQGYKIKTANSFNFVIAPDRSLPIWSANQNQFEHNQSVTADLQFNGVSTSQSHYLVGAFANNVCVGTGQPEYLPALGVYRVFLTIFGDTSNVNQPLTFKVYDTDNDIEYATPAYAPLTIVPDSSVAKIEAPYIINVQTTTGINAVTFAEGYSLMQNVPNPFARNTAISYTIPIAQKVSLNIYDESGRLVKELVNETQSAGTHLASFEQDNLQSGVYFYQMKSGDFVQTRRMLIIQ